VETNAILRTRIIKVDKFPLQVVTNDKLGWAHYMNMEDYDRDECDKDMTFGTRLTHYALIRQNGETTLMWTIHHALFDGWSATLLLHELRRLFEGLEPAMFHPFSQILHDFVQAGANDSINFWAAQLKNAAPSHLPWISETYCGRTDARKTARVSVELPTKSDVGVATIISSAWAVTLSRVTGKDDVIFGLLLNGRNATVLGIQSTTGPTISVVPVRTAFKPKQTIREHLVESQARSTERIQHQQISFAMLKAAHPEVTRACNFQTQVFIHPKASPYRDVPGLLGELGTLTLRPMAFARPIVMEFFIEDGFIDVIGHYDSTIVESDIMKTIIDDIRVALTELAAMSSEKVIADIQCQLQSGQPGCVIG
jgi:hypothetical protein